MCSTSMERTDVFPLSIRHSFASEISSWWQAGLTPKPARSRRSRRWRPSWRRGIVEPDISSFITHPRNEMNRAAEMKWFERSIDR